MKLAAGQLKADEGSRPGGGSSPQLSGNQQLARGEMGLGGTKRSCWSRFGTNVVVNFANQPSLNLIGILAQCLLKV